MYIILYNSIQTALLITTMCVFIGMSIYIAVEPTISRAVTGDFTVTQSITSEVSFLTSTSNVSFSPSIAGVTGGISSGTTTVVVLTNDAAGYNMTISFASTTANSGIAMNGNTQGGYIENYTPTSAGIPDFTFSVPANTAEFAYTVGASTTADLDITFRNNGSVCNNSSGGDTAFSCWMNPTTSPTYAETIVNRSSATTASGATTSIAFRLQITANPSPSVPEDTYIATATLTAITN